MLHFLVFSQGITQGLLLTRLQAGVGIVHAGRDFCVIHVTDFAGRQNTRVSVLRRPPSRFWRQSCEARKRPVYLQVTWQMAMQGAMGVNRSYSGDSRHIEVSRAQEVPWEKLQATCKASTREWQSGLQTAKLQVALSKSCGAHVLLQHIQMPSRNGRCVVPSGTGFLIPVWK